MYISNYDSVNAKIIEVNISNYTCGNGNTCNAVTVHVSFTTTITGKQIITSSYDKCELGNGKCNIIIYHSYSYIEIYYEKANPYNIYIFGLPSYNIPKYIHVSFTIGSVILIISILGCVVFGCKNSSNSSSSKAPEGDKNDDVDTAPPYTTINLPPAYNIYDTNDTIPLVDMWYRDKYLEYVKASDI